MTRLLPVAFAVVSAVVLSACSDKASTVDPASPPLPSSFAHFSLPVYLFDTDSISVVPGSDKTPQDPVTIPLAMSVEGIGTEGAEVTSAMCTITVTASGKSITTAPLTKQGTGRFGGTVDMKISRGDAGDYTITITGTDNRGVAVNPVIAGVRVINGRKAPDITKVTAPDTLVLPTDGSSLIITLMASVTDSSGRGDIKSVYFNSFLPDNRPSSGNPYIMYDDGSHGDGTARDGIYSLDVVLPPTAAKGTYRFEFHAIDLSNLSSKTVIHRVTVR